MHAMLAVTVVCMLFGLSAAAYDDVLKCLVCKVLVEEAEAAINAVDPKKVVDIGGRIQADGSMKTNKKLYKRSSLQLDDLLEEVCERFEDYVDGTWKDTGVRDIIPIVINGQMHPKLGEFDIKQDHELNEGLKKYCMIIKEEEEDAFMEVFAVEHSDAKAEFCEKSTDICRAKHIEL